MADGEVIDDKGAVEITRPDALPESYWDPEAKAPNYEILGKDLAELPTLRELKTKHDERVAAIPKDGKYSFDLPKEYQTPAGQKWTVDAKDPIAQLGLQIGKDAEMTQAQFATMMARWADFQLQISKDAEAEKATALAQAEKETKDLGEGAVKRREALTTWYGSDASGISPAQAALFAPELLKTKAGVETLESLQKVILANVQARGNPGNGAGNDRAEELAAHLGKAGGGLKILEAAYEGKRK